MWGIYDVRLPLTVLLLLDFGLQRILVPAVHAFFPLIAANTSDEHRTTQWPQQKLLPVKVDLGCLALDVEVV